MRFKLVPTNDAFFDYFSDSAQNAAECARRLRELISDFTDVAAKHQRVVDCEQQGDRHTQKIVKALNHSFVTPFDREDIHRLAEEFDDVCDDMLAVSDLLQLVAGDVILPELLEQADILCKITEQACLLMEKLPKMRGVEPFLEAIDKIESEGDTVYRRTLGRLFAEHDALTILRWKDVVSEMEKAINTVEDISDVVESVVLKHA
jgi:predicted phosphate transport protein (TIGR00153 family)